MKKTITWLVLIAATIAILGAPANLGNIGTGDYRAYWSASYLLRHGDAFADGDQLYRVEHELTDFPESYPVMTWNPPWLLVMLEPYTFASFSRPSGGFRLISRSLLWRSPYAAVLPIAIIVWHFYPVREMSRLVEATLFVSIITAPFGWSYDHIVLLIPLVHVIIDLHEGGLPRAYSLLWAIVLIQVDVILFWARSISRNDVFFFWVPLLLATIYFIVRWQISRANTIQLATREMTIS